MNAISFYESDGRIVSQLSGDAVVIQATIENTDDLWVDGQWDGNTHYVLKGDVTERPINPATLDNLTLSNLPVPCKIVINGTAYDADEPEVELDLPMATTYKITVMAFPYLDAEFTIET